MVTNSSAAVGCMPIVASKVALVAPAFSAMAIPWMISPQICQPLIANGFGAAILISQFHTDLLLPFQELQHDRPACFDVFRLCIDLDDSIEEVDLLADFAVQGFTALV